MKQKSFRRLNLITLSAVLLLIAVGSIVRVMDSGMGCPDWPKCFGRFIPPVSDENLPDGYESAYVDKRLGKNERLIKIFDSLGFDSLADKIKSDENIIESHKFNVIKAWIEYLNRLLGAIIGLLILITTYFAFSYWKEKRMIPVIASFSLLLVIFQGWVGSLVVSTNLIPGFVSFHMGIAFLLTALLVYNDFKTKVFKVCYGKYKYLGLSIFMLLLPQIFLGTQVRESIDIMLHAGALRDTLLQNVPVTFYVHRSFSILLLIVMFLGVFKLIKDNLQNSLLGKIYIISGILIIFEMIGGAIMTYFSLPKILQPVHLLSAAILFVLTFYVMLLTTPKYQRI